MKSILYLIFVTNLNYFKEKLKLPKFPHPAYPHPKWGWEKLGEKYPLAGMGITTEIVKASIPDENPEHLIGNINYTYSNTVENVTHASIIDHFIANDISP